MPSHWLLCFLVTPCYLQDAVPCQWSPSNLLWVLRIWESVSCSQAFFLPGFKASLGASTSTSKLVVLHADLQNIAPVQLFVWIITINKKGNSGRFYLRVMAGRLRYKKSEIWRDYEIWTLFAINEIS